MAFWCTKCFHSFYRVSHLSLRNTPARNNHIHFAHRPAIWAGLAWQEQFVSVPLGISKDSWNHEKALSLTCLALDAGAGAEAVIWNTYVASTRGPDFFTTEWLGSKGEHHQRESKVVEAFLT